MRPDASKFVRFLPSPADAAFLMPLVFLFVKLEGARTLLADGDTGWHIRAGEWMLAHGCVPRQDLFSFTRPGESWFAWEWLADVIMAWLHRHGGMAAVVLASMLVLSFTFAVLYRVVREACGNVLVSIGVVAMAVGGSSIHWLARPHLVTLWFTAIFCLILGRGRRLWLLPVLMVPWTNLHGGFFVGILIILCYAAGELFAAPRGEALGRSRRYWMAAGGCLVASLVNPYFYHLHAHVARYLASDSYQFRHIQEFLSLSFRHPAAVYFEIVLALALMAAFWNVSRRRYGEALLLAGWAHLALLSARNIPIFLIVAAAPVAVAVTAWLEAALPEFEAFAARMGTIERLPRVPVTAVAAMAALAAALHGAYPAGKFRAVYDDRVFPAAALVSLRAHGAGRIFTSDQWGDYLIYRMYPQIRVFVDGRSDFYGPNLEQTYLNILNVRYDWNDTLARYAIDTVLLSPEAPLAGALKESRRWRAVYDDGVAIVFRPRGAPEAEPVSGGKKLVAGWPSGLPPENPPTYLGAN